MYVTYSNEVMKVEKLAVKQTFICLPSMPFKLNSQEVSWQTVLTEVKFCVMTQMFANCFLWI